MKRIIEFDVNSTKLQGPIVDWCRVLQSTQIYGLELREVHVPVPLGPASLVVDIKLMDGAMYRLQRSIRNGRPSDTIDNLHHSDLEPNPHVSIHFSEGQCPDLFFVLSVCYGIARQDELSKPLSPNFFSLGLMLNVAQLSFPRRDIAKDSVKSSVESLWYTVFQTMENHGQVFWADTIAERVKLIMRELIYKAAYNKISADLQHDHFDDLGIDPSSAAISAIMRAEALLEARELSQFHTWDEAWDRCWMRRARQSQVASRWKLLRDPKLGNLPDQNAEATPHINTTGRQAGRLPNRVQLHSLSLSKISLALIKAGLVGAYWTHESFSPGDPKGKRAEIRPIKSSALRGWDSSGLPNVRNQSLATPCVTLAHNPAALSSVNLHEDVREQFFWISAIEIAFEKAWDKVWPLAVQTGEAAAKNLQASSPGAQEGTQTRRPSHTTSSVPCRTSSHPAVSGVIACGTILVRWLTRTFSATRGLKSQQASHHQPAEEHEVNTSLPPPGQASRSKSTKGAKVLKEALGLDQSRPLDDTHVAYNWVHIARRYQQEYHNKKEEALQYSKRVLNIKRNRREGPFFDFELKTLAEEAWKLTQWGQDDTGDNKNNQIMPIWKESWIEAWQAVWDQTWHIGVTKGVEFGMEKVLDESSKFKRSTYIFTKLTSTGSHKKLQEEFAAQDSHFSSLQRFYSMMKELQHIFESHQRCIHNVHHDRVKITNFPAEQALLPKLSHDMQEPKLPYVISHFQLQRLVIEKWVPENARSDFRADIGEVWYLAWSAHQTLHKNSSIARTVTMQKCSGVPIRSKEGSSVEADSHQSKQV